MAGYIGNKAVALSTTAANVTGTITAGALDISGDTDVDGTTNLDVVDIDGAVDMASTLAVAGVVTANAGVVVDNITIDGTEIDLSSGSLTIDAHTDIKLDADSGLVYLSDNGTDIGLLNVNNSDLTIRSLVSDKNIVFQGSDGGSTITALELDMSEAGAATFNSTVTANAGVVVDNITIDGNAITVTDTNGSLSLTANGNGNVIVQGNSGNTPDFLISGADDSSDVRFFMGGVSATTAAQFIYDTDAEDLAININDKITLDAGEDIILDAENNGKVQLHDGGTYYGLLRRDTNDFQLYSIVQDGDMVFRGNDGGSNVTALTLDMSDAGTATFNGNVGIGVSPTDSSTFGKALDVSSSTGAGLYLRDAGDSTFGAIGMFNTNLSINSKASSGNIVFYSNDSEKARIDGSGNLQLSNGGSFLVKDRGSILVYNTNDDNYARIQNTSASGNELQFSTNALAMTIDINGKVGIGTTAPTGIHSSAKVLEISGGDGGDLIIGNNASGNIGAGAHIGAIAFKNIDTTSGTAPLYAGIRSEAVDTTGNMDLRFYTGTGNLEADTPQVIIGSNGDVLFGNGNSHSPKIQGTTNSGRTEGSPGYSFNDDLDTGMFQPLSAANTIAFSTGGTERMRINSAGEVGINTAPVGTVALSVTADSSNHAMIIKSVSAGFASAIVDNTDSSGTRNFISFRINNSTKGAITSDGSTTTYGTGSDYRLKENVNYSWDATTRLKQLKPARFDWIGNSEAETQDGFLAHEVSSVVSNAVIGEKDAVNDDGSIDAQNIDHSKLVPLLVKTIQELEARIATLEAG